MDVNEQAIELLAPRLRALSRSLCEPIPVGDVNESEREKKLEQWAHILQGRESSLTQRSPEN